jgi:hypothetical protein
VEIDASEFGVGVVLMQNHHPIVHRKSLSPKLRGLSTYEKEYVAILLAVEHWRSYLQLVEFSIVTDQKSLSYLNEQRLHTSWQQKVFTKLLGLNYRIVYKRVVTIEWQMPCLEGLRVLQNVMLYLFVNLSGLIRWLRVIKMMSMPHDLLPS